MPFLPIFLWYLARNPPMVESLPDSPLATADDRELEYRSVDLWAVLALLAGLASPLAMLAQLLWLVPVVGIAAGVVSLRRFAAAPIHTGRALALLGLLLSMTFLVAPLARWLVADVLVRNQPRAMADAFFDYLHRDHPEKAYLLKVPPELRPNLDQDVWVDFRRDSALRTGLKRFIAEPPVRTLLALADRATIRYYKTESTASEGSRAMVNYLYTVTFDNDQHQKETFVIAIILERRPTAPDLNPWRVRGIVAGIDPATGEPQRASASAGTLGRRALAFLSAPRRTASSATNRASSRSICCFSGPFASRAAVRR